MKRYRRDSWLLIVYETSRYVERGSCLSRTQRRQELMWPLFFLLTKLKVRQQTQP